MDYYELSKLDFTQKADMLFNKLREDEIVSVEFIIEHSDYDSEEVHALDEGELNFHVRDIIESKCGDEVADLIMEHDY